MEIKKRKKEAFPWSSINPNLESVKNSEME
jgi:hypothetical protein